MTMPLTIEWKLVTEGTEKRVVDQDNHFYVKLEGYKLFPMHERIEIRRHQESDQIGFGEIVELTWKDNQTICTYQLLSLYSVN
ncbi:hypothetical protein GCM10011351_06400 [Paraliobacillus quinghaiensis]|uniref:DUF2584 domain-containing protein n=1 Tax=Paraliobacillus quinghaiensis TaxID=470815 RepID=A0A917WRT5_9BACI|nr:DUF2584 family protein [Paraliobacillus quinghaiensis]GGM23319.1 hypothetical protein GCM10011351_06400 [Paraliobacillus quinghaiensis]